MWSRVMLSGIVIRRRESVEQLMYSVDEAAAMIRNGEVLLLAGDERLLCQLPRGVWIGGTIPYFMSEKGREITRDRIFVTRLPSFIGKAVICSYDAENVSGIYRDAPS